MTKPIDLEELQVILRRAVHVSQLEREHQELLARVSGDSFEGILGTSSQMQEVLMLKRIGIKSMKSRFHFNWTINLCQKIFADKYVI